MDTPPLPPPPTLQDQKQEQGADSLAPRFTSQSHGIHDVLQSQTVGLVPAAEFRKRRAEAMDGQMGMKSTSAATEAAGDGDDGMLELEGAVKKKKSKKKKMKTTGKLSFHHDDDNDADANDDNSNDNAVPTKQVAHHKLRPNTSVAAPRILTKAAMARDAIQREALKKEFLIMQARVKRTPLLIPFVFFDGTAIPAGHITMLKGDHIWLFLDAARKVGAKQDLSGAGLKGWARVSVDDLMLVRGDVIVPHHYDFLHFIQERPKGPDGRVLFEYEAGITTLTPEAQDEKEKDLMTATLHRSSSKIKEPKEKVPETTEILDGIEGTEEEPEFTKVVDRRWYEKNKHIFPASVWVTYEPGRKLETEVRRDAGGNPYFFA